MVVARHTAFSISPPPTIFPLRQLSQQRVELLMQINIRKLAYAGHIYYPTGKMGVFLCGGGNVGSGGNIGF